MYHFIVRTIWAAVLSMVAYIISLMLLAGSARVMVSFGLGGLIEGWAIYQIFYNLRHSFTIRKRLNKTMEKELDYAQNS